MADIEISSAILVSCCSEKSGFPSLYFLVCLGMESIKNIVGIDAMPFRPDICINCLSPISIPNSLAVSVSEGHCLIAEVEIFVLCRRLQSLTAPVRLSFGVLTVLSQLSLLLVDHH